MHNALSDHRATICFSPVWQSVGIKIINDPEIPLVFKNCFWLFLMKWKLFLLYPYGYEMTPSEICFLLSSFALSAILLIFFYQYIICFIFEPLLWLQYCYYSVENLCSLEILSTLWFYTSFWPLFFWSTHPFSMR